MDSPFTKLLTQFAGPKRATPPGVSELGPLEGPLEMARAVLRWQKSKNFIADSRAHGYRRCLAMRISKHFNGLAEQVRTIASPCPLPAREACFFFFFCRSWCVPWSESQLASETMEPSDADIWR